VIMTTLLADLRTDEGVRLMPYTDTTGHLSIGVGRNLTTNGISDAEADVLLRGDIDKACVALDREHLWWRNLPDGPARAMVGLCFNLGPAGLNGFILFLNAMELGDWPRACDELQRSKWWGQAGTRGPRMVARIMGRA